MTVNLDIEHKYNTCTLKLSYPALIKGPDQKGIGPSIDQWVYVLFEYQLYCLIIVRNLQFFGFKTMQSHIYYIYIIKKRKGLPQYGPKFLYIKVNTGA